MIIYLPDFVCHTLICRSWGRQHVSNMWQSQGYADIDDERIFTRKGCEKKSNFHYKQWLAVCLSLCQEFENITKASYLVMQKSKICFNTDVNQKSCFHVEEKLVTCCNPLFESHIRNQSSPSVALLKSCLRPHWKERQVPQTRGRKYYTSINLASWILYSW